jgi:carboxynorspermidine decarboxylase
VAISDHVIFNSPGAASRGFAQLRQAARAAESISMSACGSIPEHAEGEVPRNMTPAHRIRDWAFQSSLLKAEHLEGVSGLHFHTLCEQDFEPLQRTWESLKPKIAPYFGQLKWLNFGGGTISPAPITSVTS